MPSTEEADAPRPLFDDARRWGAPGFSSVTDLEATPRAACFSPTWEKETAVRGPFKAKRLEVRTGGRLEGSRAHRVTCARGGSYEAVGPPGFSRFGTHGHFTLVSGLISARETLTKILAASAALKRSGGHNIRQQPRKVKGEKAASSRNSGLQRNEMHIMQTVVVCEGPRTIRAFVGVTILVHVVHTRQTACCAFDRPCRLPPAIRHSTSGRPASVLSVEID